ncbi:MAG: serine/threonine-protein kinase [Phycisphaerales bacterium]|nr:serine/threonine-protein kinase [Phycisphaerales bacterium]
MSRSRNKTLIEQTVTQDLFGPRALTEAAEVEVPEKYEIQECLGRGGFGVVYKALDKSLDRPVALKFLTDARPADLERFRREARFAARLNNPAIVQVYEFGECDGQPYIAMQYIDGQNLAETNLEPDEVVRVIRTATKALQHAHEEGIVHRDFKPANVLLDREGRTYLTDFGVARDLQGGTATISQQGTLLGTPALMSPEQARGDLQAIDARADIYAIGASLYWLLCRRYPFERTNLVDVLHAVVHDEPPLPRSINPSIPRALEAILLKCMQKERRGRYQSMAEVTADLDDYLEGRTVKTETAEWFRKLVGAKPRAPSTDPDLFQTVGIEIARGISAWDSNLYRVSKNITRFHPQLDSIIERLDKIIEVNPDVAWAYFYQGIALFRRGRLDEALDAMERSIDRLANQATAQFEMGRLYLALYLREQQKAHKHLTRLGVDRHLADTRGRLHQAEVCFKETQRLRSDDLMQWQIDYARAVSRLADRDHSGCVEMCDQILAQDPDLDEVWKLRGDALRFSGKEPFESYDEAIRVRRSHYDAYMAKAEAHLDHGRLGEARDCLRQALEIHPDYIDALAQIGRTYLLEARERKDEIDPKKIHETIDEGLNHLSHAATVQPRCYEVIVTQAELLIEKSRLLSDEPSLEAAIDCLHAATDLNGCQNRVKYLTAGAHFDRAMLRRERGADPRGDLEKVLAYEDNEPYLHDDNPWRDLLQAARKELAGLR